MIKLTDQMKQQVVKLHIRNNLQYTCKVPQHHQKTNLPDIIPATVLMEYCVLEEQWMCVDVGGGRHLPSPRVTLMHLHGQGGSLHTEGRAGGKKKGMRKEWKKKEWKMRGCSLD